MGKTEDVKPVISKLQDFEQRVQQNIHKPSESYQSAQRRAQEVVQEVIQEVSPASGLGQTKRQAARPRKVNQVEKVLTDTHLTPQQKAHRLEAIKSQDLTEPDNFKFEITNENLVHSLIMAELLAPPKSKR